MVSMPLVEQIPLLLGCWGIGGDQVAARHDDVSVADFDQLVTWASVAALDDDAALAMKRHERAHFSAIVQLDGLAREGVGDHAQGFVARVRVRKSVRLLRKRGTVTSSCRPI